MNELKKCEQCQTVLPEHAPFGVCPACVLNLAAEHDPPADANLTSASESASAKESLEPNELNKQFPNLEILSLLGRGGMGSVYLARQTSLDRIVALKVLSRSLSDDPSFTERFAREAKTLAQLTHPNIVTVFDSGQVDDTNYLVMEYIDGVNLRDAIASRTIDPARALAIVQQICDALQHAHDVGVIHRDIKPENILIDRCGLVKIADFGLAKLLRPKPEEFSLTGTRQVLGTRNYMAPEQIEKPDSVDHRADLYSLGVVLYELLTGELPIGRFAPPSERSQCGERLDELVMRTLEKDPDQRFQQASMIGSAVRELESAIEQTSSPTPLVEAVTRSELVSPPRQDFNQPLADPLPFTLSRLKSKHSFSKTGNAVLHLAKAHGLLHAYEDRIELEYRIHDPLDSEEKGLRTHRLKLDELASAQFEPAWWGGARLRFQAMSLKTLDEIPKAKQGTFSVDVRNRDRAAADDFADLVNRKIVSRNPNRSGAKRDRNLESMVTLEDIVLVDERLKVPRIGFWIAAFGTLIIGIALTLVAIVAFNDPDRMKSILNNTPFVFEDFIFVFGPWFLLTWIIPVVVARSLKHHRNYHLTIVLLLAMLTPWVSPLFILQIPLAIWALIVLCLPNTRRVFSRSTLDARLRTTAKPESSHRFPKAIIAIAVLTPLVLVVIGTGLFMNTQWQRARRIEDFRSEARRMGQLNLPSLPVPSAESRGDSRNRFASRNRFDDGTEAVIAKATADAKRRGFEDVRLTLSTENSGSNDMQEVIRPEPIRHKDNPKLLWSWITVVLVGFLSFCMLFLVVVLSVLGWGMIRPKKARSHA